MVDYLALYITEVSPSLKPYLPQAPPSKSPSVSQPEDGNLIFLEYEHMKLSYTELDSLVYQL